MFFYILDLKKHSFRWRQRQQLGCLGQLEWLLSDVWRRGFILSAKVLDWEVSGGFTCSSSLDVSAFEGWSRGDSLASWLRKVLGWWYDICCIYTLVILKLPYLNHYGPIFMSVAIVHPQETPSSKEPGGTRHFKFCKREGRHVKSLAPNCQH